MFSYNTFLKFLRQLVFYVSLFFVWKFIFWLKLWPPYQFPSPGQVLGVLMDGLWDKSLFSSVGISLGRIAIGYAVSVILGIALGIFIGQFKVLDETLGGLFMGLQTLPSICWLPLATLWFGFSETSVIFVIITGSFLSIAIATDNGIKGVQNIYLRVGQTMGARGVQLFRQVVLPAALPSILAGLKQGWIFAWRSLMAAEMIYVAVGIGHSLNSARQLNDTSQIIAVMILIVAIGVFVDKMVFGILQRRVSRIWGTGQTYGKN